MSKFAHTATTAAPEGALGTLDDVRQTTHEGGLGFAKDARTELFSLAVSNFVGEDTFYEGAKTRDNRFRDLVREVAGLDPEWLAAMIVWLRDKDGANMRTAAVVAAVEYARALPGDVPGGFTGRSVIAAALQRADEPAEALAYWMGAYGRTIPKGVKRGIADAATKLYTEKAALKYDSRDAKLRMGDVIELVHPKPRAPWQSALFQYLIDRRHNRDVPRGLDKLPTIAETRAAHKAAAAGEEIEVTKGMTWEAMSAHTKMDAEAWQKVIPTMGYMALLRNLRNFEDAGVDPVVLGQVAARLSSAAQVAESRQLPFRFWSAWRASGTMRFGQALEDALEASLQNIPTFRGKTLVLVDVSDSMMHQVGGANSSTSRKQVASLFGAAVNKRSAPGSQFAIYATGVAAMQDQTRSVLRTVGDIDGIHGVNGHGTNTWPSVLAMWQEHGPFERILVFTDMQDHPTRISADMIPANVPIYVWDLAGYRPGNLDVGSGRYLLAGLTDQSFKMIHMLENARRGVWPWEA